MEEERNEEDFARGFNHGYLLAKYLPETVLAFISPDLSAMFAKPKDTFDYIDGFVDGRGMYFLEQPETTMELKSIWDNEINEEDFNRGFNHGYMLSKYLPELGVKLITPELAAMIARPENDFDYIEGFNDGKAMYILEQPEIIPTSNFYSEEDLPPYLQDEPQTRTSPQDKDIDSREDVDLEPDL